MGLSRSLFFILTLYLITVELSIGAPKLVRLSNGAGNTFTLALETKEPLKSLANVNGLGTLEEVCNQGVWVLYTLENFEGKAEIFPYINRCEIPWFSSYRSLRSVGFTDDITIPTATFFSEINLNGNIIGESLEGFPDFSESLPKSIVTINTDVEFFRDPNYSGPSHCVDRSQLSCGHQVCWAWHFDQFDFEISNFKSARVGCSDESKTANYFYPKFIPRERSPTPITVSSTARLYNV